jgi:hypothetical protein
MISLQGDRIPMNSRSERIADLAQVAKINLERQKR